MNGLYTNRNIHGDFIENALYRLVDQGRNVFIAVAFFTEASVVEKLLEEGCLVRLIVRLGYPTNPDALLRILVESRNQILYRSLVPSKVVHLR